MTEKRKGGHEDDIKEGHDKEGLCGRNDKGGWTLGSSPRVTEKRGYEGDIKKRGEGEGNSHQKPEIRIESSLKIMLLTQITNHESLITRKPLLRGAFFRFCFSGWKSGRLCRRDYF